MPRTVVPAGHVTVTYTVPIELKAAVVALAKRNGTSAAAEVRKALQAHVWADSNQKLDGYTALVESLDGDPGDDFAAKITNLTEDGDPGDEAAAAPLPVSAASYGTSPPIETWPANASYASVPPPLPATCPHRVPVGAYCRACQKEAAA